MTRTSLARLTCRSRSHASVRKRASAAEGSDSLRLSVFFDPNSASSKALRTELREILPDRIAEDVTVEFFLRRDMDNCRERWSHIHHSGELVISPRFDAGAVENDRHVCIDIVRTAV